MRSASGFNWKEIAIRKHAWNISKVSQSQMPWFSKILSKSLLDFSGWCRPKLAIFIKISTKISPGSFTIFIGKTFGFRARMRMNCFLSKFSKIVNFGLYHPLNVILKTELAKIEFFSVMKSRLWFNDREY